MSYNTSKSAVLQMARSMACELGKKDIRVNSLSPGHIYTSYVQVPLQENPLANMIQDDRGVPGHATPPFAEVV